MEILSKSKENRQSKNCSEKVSKRIQRNRVGFIKSLSQQTVWWEKLKRSCAVGNMWIPITKFEIGIFRIWFEIEWHDINNCNISSYYYYYDYVHKSDVYKIQSSNFLILFFTFIININKNLSKYLQCFCNLMIIMRSLCNNLCNAYTVQLHFCEATVVHE